MPLEKFNQPIGVFDSGLGGITVVKELIHKMPNEDIIYFGDTARVPYGTKSKESIIRFSIENTEILLRYNVKMVVVACNTSSSYAIDILKKKFKIPILGVIEPGAIKAVKETKNKKIGVIATCATINSQSYLKAINCIDDKIKVFSKACPLFVPLVEEGWFSKKATGQIALEYLKNLKQNKIDVLVLGCTHYPLLKSTLKKIMGKKTFLIDSAKQVAMEAEKILDKYYLKTKKSTKGKLKFLISDRPQRFEEISKRFLGRGVKGVQYVRVGNTG